MNRKTLLSSLVIGLLLILQIPYATALEQSTLEVEAYDTIAGYATVTTIDDGLSNAEVEILLTKPNGSEILIETETDKDGDAKTDIDGYHLKKAGIYEISAKYIDLKQDYGQVDSFKVYEDSVSLNKSTLDSDSVTAEASGYDPVQLTVSLKDRYGNPITGHSISIISSRSEDFVTPYDSTKTDEKGEVVFYAYSEEIGVSTYTAYDTTSDLSLDQRAKVAYFSPVTTLEEIGGNNLFTSVLLASTDGTAGTIDHFEVEDLDEQVEVNELLNFTVTAYDVDENIVEDYTGTIRFSCTDDNADLPEDYTFEAEDQGTHTFSLSLRFTTTGNQEVTITDTDDRDLEGSIEIEVVSEGSGASTTTGDSDSDSDEDSDLALTSPQEGTYSSTTVEVSGSAPYGYYIDIYDNGSLADTIFTESDDTFSTELELDNGDHSIYVVAKDSDDTEYGTSSTVDLTIDTESAALDYMEIDPEGDLTAGDTFTVYVYSEPDLHQVGILLDDKIYELTESLGTDGTYVGILVTPDDAGTYSLDVILVDSLANEIQYSDMETINVVAEEAEAEEEAEEEETEGADEETTADDEATEEEAAEEEVEEEPAYPATVSGVETTTGDSRITLTWESAIASDETAFIDHYKIYYGYAENLLYSTAETYDSSTTWYIPSLQNDETYYFAVTAIDSNGLESLEKSSVVSGVPEAEEVEDEYTLGKLHDSAEEEEVNLDEVEETPESGPEVAWILLFTLVFSQVYFSTKKKIAEQSEEA